MEKPKLPKLVEMILDDVDQEVQSELRTPREANTFRGSEVGDCSRAIAYTLRGAKADRPGPELALLFGDGHLHHDAMRERLRRVTRLTNSEWGGFKRYASPLYPNGIGLTATIDCLINGKFIGELKSINTFSFKWLDKAKVLKDYRHYYLQLQVYLDVFDKEWGFLLFKDKNNSALKEFWFKRNRKVFENEVLKKLFRIADTISRNKIPVRPFAKSSRECKMCFHRISCWGVSMERRKWR